MSFHINKMDLALTTVVNSSCAPCGLGPPPNSILHIPPPPIPTSLQYGSGGYSNAGILVDLNQSNNSLCKHSCSWKAEGVEYIEIPQKGNLFDDTWLLVLISSCVAIVFIGLLIIALLLRCKFNGGMKNGSMGISAPTSTIESKNGRIQNETILYPSAIDGIQDSRVMWATLTPRGTTRHYLEEHTYETIGNGSHKRTYSSTPIEHTYVQPSILQPVHPRPQDDKAFDNTAFIDYEEALSLNSDFYQTISDPDAAETELNGPQKTLGRPRVSSPTRIENPNLPPLNLNRKKYGSRKAPANYVQSTNGLQKINNNFTDRILLSHETHKTITF